MMFKKIITLSSISLIIFFSLTITSLFHGNSYASTINTNGGGFGQCSYSNANNNANQPNAYTSIVTSYVPQGQIYARLTNDKETSTNINVYVQSIATGNCQLIGTGVVGQDSWTKIGNNTADGSKGIELVVAGKGLTSATAYQAVASILIVNGSTCNVQANCTTTYDSYTGTLQPTIISHASDEISIFVASPVKNVNISKVSYYSDNQFLYEGTVLKSVNHNYIAGGIHQITITVLFKNGESLTLHQTLNMGPDYDYALTLRSFAYRYKDQGLLIGSVVVSVAGVFALLSLLITIHRRRIEVRHHIAEGYKPHELKIEPEDDHNKIVSG